MTMPERISVHAGLNRQGARGAKKGPGDLPPGPFLFWPVLCRPVLCRSVPGWPDPVRGAGTSSSCGGLARFRHRRQLTPALAPSGSPSQLVSAGATGSLVSGTGAAGTTAAGTGTRFASRRHRFADSRNTRHPAGSPASCFRPSTRAHRISSSG